MDRKNWVFYFYFMIKQREESKLKDEKIIFALL